MAQSIETLNDINEEIEEIDRAIIRHSRIVENLKWRRYELLIREQDLEMSELIECIIEKGLTARDALRIINGSQAGN
jgi:hypothetical protein